MKKTFTLILALVVSLLTLQAGAQMYIVGSGPFGEWNLGNAVPMNAKADGTYNYTATINGAVYFVFADGIASDWDTFNSNYRYGPSSGDQAVTVNGAWVPTQKAGDHGAYFFTGNGSSYYFTIDTINKRFKVSTTEGKTRQQQDSFYAVDGLDIGHDNVIPLWMFGMLY